MKCYFHPKKDAVGLCSVCYKAVCRDCVGDDTPEIICKNCMRQGVQMLKQERNKEPILRTNFKNEPEQKIPSQSKMIQYPRKPSGPSFFQNLFREKKNLSETSNINTELITPVLFIGIITGILCGIPLLSLLFFIIIPIGGIVSVIYLRAEHEYMVYINPKKGFITGALTGLMATIISLVLIVSLEVFFGAHIYGIINGLFGFLDSGILNIIIALSGANVSLSLNGIITRLGVTIILFPILGGIFGFLTAKFLR